MRPASALDDSVLVERSKAGDHAAFEELVRRHADQLYAVVIRFVADREAAQEVTQEAFIRAWRGIGRFKGRSAFFTWLYRIGINEAKRHAGRHSRSEPVDPAEDARIADVPDMSEAPEERLAQKDLREALESAIRPLPEGYRATIVLRDIEGLSTREAAEVMDLGESAFKSRLHRARLTMRASLEEYFAESER